MDAATFPFAPAEKIDTAIFLQIANADARLPESLEALQALKPSKQRAVADLLEASVLPVVANVAAQERETPTHDLPAERQEAFNGEDNLTILSYTYLALLTVAQIKGDKSDPLTRAYVREVSALSGADAQSFSAIMDATVRAADSAKAEIFTAKNSAPKASRAPKP